MRLKWSEYARCSFTEQIGYIALRNADTAEKIALAIEHALSNILVFPRMGRVGRYPGTFEYVVSNSPLIIVYEIREDVIIVLNILHTSQDYP